MIDLDQCFEEESRAPVKIRRAAMDLLARREHSYSELVTKLTKRFSTRSSSRKADSSQADSSQADSSQAESREADSEEFVSIEPVSRESIAEEVQKLVDEGLQSDQRLAEALIRSRLNRGQGPLKIRQDLRAKGVHDTVIGLALESNDVDWFDVVRTVANKRFGEGKPADARERARRSRFLQQRGFEFEHINAVL